MLHGVYKSGMATDGTKNFFAYKKDAGMFAKASSGLTLPEGRCYFTTATSAPAREFRIGLVDDGGETTGISDAQGTASNIGHYYTLNGQRVNQPQHGIYVTNGKKIIKK